MSCGKWVIDWNIDIQKSISHRFGINSKIMCLT